MALQTQVYTEAAPGAPGDRASLNPVVHLPTTPRAEGLVRSGAFVWPGTDARAQVTGGTQGSERPAGFVERVVNHFSYDVLSNGPEIPEGAPVTVAVRGDFWAETATGSEPGMSVFASVSDGSIATAEAGTTLTGHVETGWKAVTGGGAGGLIIISNWSE